MTFDPNWVISILLVATRLTPIFWVIPLNSVISIPYKIRFLIVLGLSSILVSLLDTANLTSQTSFLAAFTQELIIGGVLASIILVFFSTLIYAGRLIDFQSGLSAAAVLNPATGSQNSLIGVLLLLTGTVVFFALDAHHTLIKALVFSFQIYPPGQIQAIQFNIQALILLGSSLFLYGLLIASPVVIGLMFMDIAFSATARTMLQMNPYFIALPAKIAAAITLTALSLTQFSPLLENLFSELFLNWKAVLKG